MRRIFKIFFLISAIFFLAFLLYIFVSRAPSPQNITWGVNFSQMQAENLSLDWKKTYITILEDLGVKNIKLLTQWDWVEGKKDNFYFNDIDWQIYQAEKHNIKIIYLIGMKTGRWPECHLPKWAKNLSKQEQQNELLKYIKEVVLRYKGQKSIIYWQAENEPLFNFGICPWYDKDFLRKEVQLIKSLDPTRQVIISDSGEMSPWVSSAQVGDILGITMYRKVWTHITDGYGFYWTSVFPPMSYWLKAELINLLFSKKVICVELQAEPWALKPFYDLPLKEQEKTMNLAQFKNNVSFAQKTGLNEFYFWGTEWWYWLKERQDKPEIWNEAKNLFKNS